MCKATYRLARKKELSDWEKHQLLEMWRNDYGHPEVEIRWVPGMRKYGLKGRWGVFMGYGLDDRDPDADPRDGFSEVGVIMICTACETVFDVISDIFEFDEGDHCPECDALFTTVRY